jgi:hypothetical protein
VLWRDSTLAMVSCSDQVSSEQEGADLGAGGERCAPTRKGGGRVWLVIRRVAEVFIDLGLAREWSTIK